MPELTTLHAACALSAGNKAMTIIESEINKFTGSEWIKKGERIMLVVQESRRIYFRWWVIEEDGHVWENERTQGNFLDHIGNFNIDPDEKRWQPI